MQKLKDRLVALEEKIALTKHYYHIVSSSAEAKKIKCKVEGCIAIIIGEALIPDRSRSTA